MNDAETLVFSPSYADSDAEASRSSFILPLFAITLFLGSFLLFVVEPMVARMVLPVLGGVPMVWNTCVVFFQLMLLVGYGYAYGASRWMSSEAHRRPRGAPAAPVCGAATGDSTRSGAVARQQSAPVAAPRAGHHCRPAVCRRFDERVGLAALVLADRAPCGSRPLFSLRVQQPGESARARRVSGHRRAHADARRSRAFLDGWLCGSRGADVRVCDRGVA